MAPGPPHHAGPEELGLCSVIPRVGRVYSRTRGTQLIGTDGHPSPPPLCTSTHYDRVCVCGCVCLGVRNNSSNYRIGRSRAHPDASPDGLQHSWRPTPLPAPFLTPQVPRDLPSEARWPPWHPPSIILPGVPPDARIPPDT